MFFASSAKRPLRDTNARADFREIEWPVGMGRKKVFELRHDCIVAAATGRDLDAGTFGEAPHHEMDQLRFQGPIDFRQFENLWSVMGQLSDCLVKLQQAGHQGWAGPNERSGEPSCEIEPDDCLNRRVKLI